MRTSIDRLAIAIASLIAGPALAQVDEVDRNNTGQVSTLSADRSIETIMVTAQRVEQRLTDVPFSVAAVSADDLDLAGVTNLRELAIVAPGVTMQSTGPWLQPAVRGVTSQATIPGSEQNVAVYVDGVYQPAPFANASDLPDIDRIEVLKGPQGTLFGRNATGGAIQVFTVDPEFRTTGRFGVSYGRYDDLAVQGYVSAPVIDDRVAFNVSGSYVTTDGWLRDLLNDGKRTGKVTSEALRAKVLFTPTESSRFVLAGFYKNREDDNVNRDFILDGNGVPRALGVTPIATNPYEVSNAHPSTIRIKSYGASLRGEIDVEHGSITSISAYMRDKLHLQTDGDQSPADLLRFELGQPVSTYSQEFLFSSEKLGRFSFVTGAFAYRSESGYFSPLQEIYIGGNLAIEKAFETTAKSYAAFAEGTYEVTYKLSVIGGARYTYEKRSLVDNNTTVPDHRSKSFNSVTPRASLIYEVTPSSNLYATFSKGFKSGQWDPSGATPIIVDPEKLTAYEMGFKTAGRALSFNVAGFYYDYKDVQLQFLDAVTGNGKLENAASEEMYGIDMDARIKVSSNVGLAVQAAWVHAKFKNFENASIMVPAVDSSGNPVGGNVGVSSDLSGRRVPRVPRFSGSLAVDYQKDFSAGDLLVSGYVYYSGKYGLENSNRIKQPDYVTLNMNALWSVGDTGLKMGVYGNNLTNEKVVQSTIFFGIGDYVSYQEPRNYGVRFVYER